MFALQIQLVDGSVHGFAMSPDLICDCVLRFVCSEGAGLGVEAGGETFFWYWQDITGVAAVLD